MVAPALALSDPHPDPALCCCSMCCTWLTPAIALRHPSGPTAEAVPERAGGAVGPASQCRTVVLLHPPPTLVCVSVGHERGRQQNKSTGYVTGPAAPAAQAGGARAAADGHHTGGGGRLRLRARPEVWLPPAVPSTSPPYAARSPPPSTLCPSAPLAPGCRYDLNVGTVCSRPPSPAATGTDSRRSSCMVRAAPDRVE